MNALDLTLVTEYVNANIGSFHDSRLRHIHELSLRKILLRKNPYLFRAKNVHTAA